MRFTKTEIEKAITELSNPKMKSFLQAVLNDKECENKYDLINKDHYFATILWQKEDIKVALEEEDMPNNDDMVEKILDHIGISEMENCEHGWDCITDAIDRIKMEQVKTVSLILNDYVGENYCPTKQTRFMISEDCLNDYLKATDDERDIPQFLESYDSDEANVIYDYASDDGRIIQEDVSYSDDVIEKYKKYMEENYTITIEDFYRNIYRQNN